MPRQVSYFSIAILVWLSDIAYAQTQLLYDRPPETATASGRLSSLLLYVVLAAAVGFIAWIAYRYYRSHNAQPPWLAGTKSEPETIQKSASKTPPAAGSIFISYRRDDSADITGRIYDRLVQRFSRDIIFKDVDSIPLGIDFRQHLENALSQCRVLVAVIGERWVGIEAQAGKRRIDDPRDHLRLELEIALARNIPVIPILVRQASIPSEEQLPRPLQSLAYRNGIHVRPDPDFHGDVDRLIKGIEGHLNK